MSRSFLNNNELEIEKMYFRLLENDNLGNGIRQIHKDIFYTTIKIMKTLDIPLENFPFVVHHASENDLEKYHSLINETLNNLVIRKPKNTKTRFSRVFKLKRKYSFLH